MACRAVRGKEELIRIARSLDGRPVLDRTGEMPGRGAYLCPSLECLERARKRSSFERALRIRLPESERAAFERALREYLEERLSKREIGEL